MTLKRSAGNVVGLDWFRSSYSDSSNSNECVEVASAPSAVRVRDSKYVQGPQLGFAPDAWAQFVAYASAG